MSASCIHIRQGGAWVRGVQLYRYNQGSWTPLLVKVRADGEWQTVSAGLPVYITTDNKILGTHDQKIYILG